VEGPLTPARAGAIDLPLPALLSAAFVAFTIEADNEAERLVPHRTTSFGASGERGALWLTSLAMWWNCLKPLAQAQAPITVAELRARARMDTNLDGMRRWGYITIDSVGRVKASSGRRPRATASSMLALTPRGERAAAVWQPVPPAIEGRWRERFGGGSIDRVRGTLVELARRDDARLPDFMPIGALEPLEGTRSTAERDRDEELGLVSLLARVLMRFTLDYRAECAVPLLGWSNLLRALDGESAVAVRDLPRRTGISKESLAMLSGRCEKAGLVAVEPRPGARGRQLRLTARGEVARSAGELRVKETVREWEARGPAVPALIAALRELAGDGSRVGSPLWRGLEPPADGWRAHAPAAEILPWYPMLTHRGGYPDGS
jgi:hypothetical protein